jgi:hypothetical protein
MYPNDSRFPQQDNLSMSIPHLNSDNSNLNSQPMYQAHRPGL